jgi:ABC-type uncharacterized transport system fused permease/ATPase subunit
MYNFWLLIKPFFLEDQKHYARYMGLFLILIYQSLVGFSFLFVQWNRRFYDALENKNMGDFLTEGYVFCGLALTFAIVRGLARYFSQQYALKWRIWMTNNALNIWLKDPTKFKTEGSDQRLQEDLMRFTTIVERYFLEGLNCIILILWFIPILFSLTSGLKLNGLDLSWAMLFSVILYTAVGMFIAIKIARPLIKIEYNNQKFEAELRYQLVHSRDGEDKTLEYFSSLLQPIISNYKKMYTKQKQFNIWQEAYNQFSFFIPFILLAPNYFAGLISFGQLMQIKSTFSRIRNAMAFIMDHYTEITELQAISKRLLEFYIHLDLIDNHNCKYQVATL